LHLAQSRKLIDFEITWLMVVVFKILSITKPLTYSMTDCNCNNYSAFYETLQPKTINHKPFSTPVEKFTILFSSAIMNLCRYNKDGNK